MKPLLTTKEAAEILRVGAPTLRRLRWSGGGPRYLKRGKRCLYDPTDIQSWVDSQKRENTSALAPGRAA
jgi:excisionase family DNA binding protein